MKVEFPSLEPVTRLNLNISNGLNSLEIGSTLVKHVKDHIALISLDHTEHVLKFDNVSINAVYTNPEGIPTSGLMQKLYSIRDNT